jgi:hypothetical protein
MRRGNRSAAKREAAFAARSAPSTRRFVQVRKKRYPIHP